MIDGVFIDGVQVAHSVGRRHSPVGSVDQAPVSVEEVVDGRSSVWSSSVLQDEDWLFFSGSVDGVNVPDALVHLTRSDVVLCLQHPFHKVRCHHRLNHRVVVGLHHALHSSQTFP